MDQIDYYNAKLKNEIDSWDLLEEMKMGKKIKIVDTRSKEYFDVEHIPDAINIPYKTMNDDLKKSFDKLYLYVTYCEGNGCLASAKGALKLAELGFRTKELVGGIDWWKRNGHSTVSLENK